MDLTIEEFERLEAYLQGYLTEDKRKEYEAEIAKNPALKQEIETQKQLFSGFKALKADFEQQQRLTAESSALKEQINAAHQRYLEQEEKEVKVIPLTPKKPFSYTQWATAASVVLVLGFGWFYRAQYYIPSDARAMTDRELSYKDFALKLPPNPTPTDMIRNKQKVLWFVAMAKLESKHKKQAKEILTKIAATNGHPYQEKAKTMLEKL
ncbi:hypothetical protein [Runella sp.]|uniref:hypothetical protein n=1 Tax=Runella sp. TaxID=1960881 RepID=UPI003D0F4F36